MCDFHLSVIASLPSLFLFFFFFVPPLSYVVSFLFIAIFFFPSHLGSIPGNKWSLIYLQVSFLSAQEQIRFQFTCTLYRVLSVHGTVCKYKKVPRSGVFKSFFGASHYNFILFYFFY
ncbi:hypothetical protein BDZ91DRAFT_138268 [Kalaharituber pfeilii]|nr:hypothetical protein BDZ91DRAFT_138268 [Kalaharituber pfeilii]